MDQYVRRVHNETGQPYCEYSCSYENGGCAEGRQCVEIDVPCNSGECYSPTNVTCVGIYVRIGRV